MNKWTLRFKSNKLERQYTETKIPILLQAHRIETIIYAIINSVTLVMQILSPGKYEDMIQTIVICLVKLFQYLYVVRRNNRYLSISISFSNVFLASIDMITMLKAPPDGAITNHIRSSTYSIYHFCLLLQPDFVQNVGTLFSIAIIKTTCLNFETFRYQTIENFSTYILYLYILYVRTQEQRLRFMQIYIDERHEDLIDNQISESIIVGSYDKECMKFDLQRANKHAREQLGITNSEELRGLLRSFYVSTKDTLENYIFKKFIATNTKDPVLMELTAHDKANNKLQINLQYYHLNRPTIILVAKSIPRKEDMLRLDRNFYKQRCQLQKLLVKVNSVLQHFDRRKQLALKTLLLNINMSHITSIQVTTQQFNLGTLLRQIVKKTVHQDITVTTDRILLTHLILTLISGSKQCKSISCQHLGLNFVQISLRLDSLNLGSMEARNCKRILALIGPYRVFRWEKERIAFTIYQDLNSICDLKCGIHKQM